MTVFGVLVILCIFAAIVLSVLFLIRLITKKPKMWIGLSALFCVAGIIIFTIIGSVVWVANMTPEEREAYYEEQRLESEQREAERLAEEQARDAENATTEKKTPSPAIATPTPAPTPTQIESAEDYKASCEEVSWTDLARYPDKYVGQRIKVTGQVSQIIDGSWLSDGGYRVYEDYDFSVGDTWLKKEWYIAMDPENASPRILEDDVITFYGEFAGTTKIVRALTETKEDVITLDAAYYTIQE